MLCIVVYGIGAQRHRLSPGLGGGVNILVCAGKFSEMLLAEQSVGGMFSCFLKNLLGLGRSSLFLKAFGQQVVASI